MILRHATPARKLDSIHQFGLLACLSQGAIETVWLHSARWSAWAALHVHKRHECDVDDLVIIEVSIPRHKLVRTGRKGIWRTNGADIPTSAFRRIFTLESVLS